jgi:acyl-CoA thioesterase
MDDILVRSRFVAATGARVEEKRPGYARMSVQVRPEHLTARRELHGGVITSLMDSALAVALRELRGDGSSLHSSIEMNASFLSPAGEGRRLTIEGRITDLQAAVAFGEAEARDEDGELLAKGRVTFAIQQPGTA